MWRWMFGATLALLAAPAFGQGTLQGRMVTMNTLTYDDPSQPMLESRGATVMVGDGIEFGMGPEGARNGLDVVPVIIEIGPDRIEISYDQRAGAGQFWPALFNGYVLRFTTECALFTSARIDHDASTIPVQDTAIKITNDALYINVSGMTYWPTAKMAIDLSVTDCGLS